MSTHTTYYDATHEVTAHDRGGAYIDLYHGAIAITPDDGMPIDPLTGDMDVSPFDTINVWDYRTGDRVADVPRGALDETYARIIDEHLTDEDARA